MKRTDNKMFNKCPLCSKSPKILIPSVNYGLVMCDGSFLRRHKKIEYEVQYSQPSTLMEKLYTGWNQFSFRQ